MFRRTLHFGLRMLGFLAFFFILVILLTQVTLWTNIPSSRVLSSLSRKTGMEFKAQRFRTTITGITRIYNLTIRFPTEEEPYVFAEEVTLEHNSLLTWFIGRKFRLERINIDNGSIQILEDHRGRWNVQSLLELVKTPEVSTNTRNLNLPEISAENIRIRVRNNRKEELLVDSARMTAIRNELMWEFQIFIEPVMTIKGSIAQAPPFNQRININLQNPGALSAGIVPNILDDVSMRAVWNGVTDENTLNGLLRIESSQIKDIKIRGDVKIEANTDYIRVQADTLNVEHTRLNEQRLRILGGRLEYFNKDKILAMTDVNVLAGNSQVAADAKWDMQSGKANSSGRWVEIANGFRARTDCKWTGQAVLGRAGIKNAEIKIDGFWQRGEKQLQVDAIASGTGPEWKKSLWIIKFPVLSWQDRLASFDLGPGLIDIAVDWPATRLSHVELSNLELMDAEGYYLASGQNWGLAVNAKGIRIQRNSNSQLADFEFDITGNSEQIEIKKAQLECNDLQANAAGVIDLKNGDFKAPTVNLSGRLPVYKQKAISGFSGKEWSLNAKAEGKIEPIDVRFAGELVIDVNQPAQSINDTLRIPFHLHADGPDLRLETASYKNEYGSWLFSGYYHTATDKGSLLVDFNDIKLSTLSSYIDGNNCEGEVSGSIASNFQSFDFSEMKLKGKWEIKNFKSAVFAAQTGSGQIEMSEGIARLGNIYLKQGPGRITGDGILSLNGVKEASFKIQSEDWPYPVNDSPMRAFLNSDVDVNINISNRTVTAIGHYEAYLNLFEQPLGKIDGSAEFKDRILSINSLDGLFLDGNVNGKLRVPLGNISNSQADIVFKNIKLERILGLQQKLEGFSGLVTGHILIDQAEEKNPLEATKIVIGTKIEDGQFRGAQIGSMRLTAFAGPNRVLVTESILEMFSGLIQAQWRWTLHDRSLIHARTKIDDIDLAQIVRAINPNLKPVEGIIDGDATVLTTADLNSLSGKVLLRLSNSNLINSNIISTIYQSLAPGQKPSRPEGYGTIEIYPQGSKVEISSFYYFNEGVEIRGSGRIDDIRKGAESPVSGLVFGTTKPLAGLKLPGIRELDELIGVLQVGAAVVRIKGTLNNIQTEVVPFPQVGGAIRSLVWKQLHEEGQ